MAEPGGVRLLVMSDTHLPRRAKDLPDPLWNAVAEAEVVVHAGDWCTTWLLEAVAGRVSLTGGRLIAVYGNNDGADLRSRLPLVATATVAGVRLAVVHETGGAAGREQRCDAQFPDSDLLVFGHSHIPWDSTSPRGLRLLNPGSPTDRRSQPFHTFVTARLDGGSISDVHLHRI